MTWLLPHLPFPITGRRARVAPAELVGAILYKLKTGCQRRWLPVAALFSGQPLTWQANHYHVVRSENGWGVKPEGATRSIGNSSTQSGAQAIARRHAIANQGEVIIHRPNGRIRARDSYGNDPAIRLG